METRIQPLASAERHPLLAHAPDAIAAWRGARAVTASEMLRDVAAMAAVLPERGPVLNLCTDRYRFTVAFLAAVARGQLTLMPPATTSKVIEALREFAPDLRYIADDAETRVDLPRIEAPAASVTPWTQAPLIPADQVVACVFTSGSTGVPQPSFKTWGSLMHAARNEGERFGIGPGHTVLGTVPPQHMFGFESTVMLPLGTGATLTAERPFHAGDIDAAIERLPAPRVLFTTPFHLRAWLGSDDPARLETIVSATAPLPLELARDVERRTGACLLEIYGCTEAGQIATRRPTASPDWLLYPDLKLREHDGKAVVAGGHVEEPVALQDVIEVLGDGTRFALHGRFSDMVNIAGKRNSLGYLNHQLTAIEGVEDGVFFVPEECHAAGVTRLTAFVVAPTLGEAEILAALRERIDPAFLPRPLVKVASLPRQLTGKLPRDALNALGGARGRTPKAP